MLDYKVKIGLVAMRRNTTDRPRGTFLTWYSAEQRGKRFTEYIEKNFTGENGVHYYTGMGTKAFTMQVINSIKPHLGIDEEIEYKEVLHKSAVHGF